MFGASRVEKAYLAPYAAFLLCFLPGDLVQKAFEGQAVWWAAAPRYWIFPLQTAVTGALLVWGWRQYELRRPAAPLLAIIAGIFALVVWIAPGWFGAPPRLEGFNPGYFGTPGTYALDLTLRFLRLVVIVPFAEEIFWRGFLARYLVRHDFQNVPVGAFTQLSFWVVTAGFCLEHSPPDWPAALVTGALYNAVAWRTRSLSACILTHAVTNALLGLWILHTGQWGYW